MLSLDDPRWSELQHAYGAAADIPSLLQQLADLPPSENDREPWSSIWSALAHQGDVYSASFAAVPHVIDALASAPSQADSSYFQFPAWVEVCRVKSGDSVPEDIAPAYFESLSRLPALVAAAASRPWDEGSPLRSFGNCRSKRSTGSRRNNFGAFTRGGLRVHGVVL